MGRGRAGSAVTAVPKAELSPGTGKSDIITSPGAGESDVIASSHLNFNSNTPVHISSPAASSQSKFDEIRKSNQAAAQRLAENQYSSSSDDDDEDEVLGKQGRILESTLTTYTSQTG